MKKNTYLSRIVPLTVALLTSFFAGCENQTTTVRESNTTITGPMGASEVTAKSRAAELQIEINASAQDSKDTDLANSVRSQIAGRLNKDGLQLSPRNGDLKVAVSVNSEVFDKSGNYYRMEGSAETSIYRTFDSSMINSKIINVRAERKLGEAVARDALVAELSRMTAEWIADNLSDTDLQLSVNDIEVKIPSSHNSVEYSAMFIQKVVAIEGVASVVLINQNSAQKALTFRVLYFQKKLPSGILHQIAQIEELNIQL